MRSHIEIIILKKKIDPLLLKNIFLLKYTQFIFCCAVLKNRKNSKAEERSLLLQIYEENLEIKQMIIACILV